jgi:hypothetical protein
VDFIPQRSFGRRSEEQFCLISPINRSAETAVTAVAQTAESLLLVGRAHASNDFVESGDVLFAARETSMEAAVTRGRRNPAVNIPD